MPHEMLKTLNTKELAVYSAFPRPESGTDGDAIQISDLAAKAFPKKGTTAGTKGNSWVRNSLRKLVKLEFVRSLGHRSGGYVRVAGSPSPGSVARKKEEPASTSQRRPKKEDAKKEEVKKEESTEAGQAKAKKAEAA